MFWGVEMNKKFFVALLASLLTLVLVLAALLYSSGLAVFSDDFSGGNLSSWSRTNISPGSSQTVSNGVARFIVPSPTAGTVTYSSIIKDGFTSTANSTITASQDILVTKVPNGCPQGNGAIFFLYICDSANLAGNIGNIGVGIDGSSVWSLWIGGNTTYTYVFQTAGPAPVSNTWYHVVLTIDNSAGLVSLAVGDTVVVSATQQQFTDRSHSFSLMVGLGEAWWSDCVGPQEVDVDNVRLDVSDAGSTLNPTSIVYSPPATASTSTVPPTPANTPTVAPTATPNSTASPSISASPTPTVIRAAQEDGFPFWIILPMIVAVIVVGVLFVLKKR